MHLRLVLGLQSITRRLVVPIPLLVLVSGCAVLGADPPPDRPTRGKLSDAAEQASEDPEKQDAAKRKAAKQQDAKTRSGETTSESEKRKRDDDDEWVLVPGQPDDDDPVLLTVTDGGEPSSPTMPGRFLIGAFGGVGFEAGGIFERIEIGGVEVGAGPSGDRTAVAVRGLIMRPRLSTRHGLYTSIKDDVTELAAELGARYYLTPEHTFLGTYVLGGYRIGWMQWDWRKPVLIPNDSGGTDEFRNDSLVTHAIFVGVGLSPVQLKHVHLGVNVAYGLKFYSQHTGENFENDLFRDVGFGRLLVEAVYVR